tara:strand:- start:64 stop:318 length:255 start_codon:yes stop_codon:yes gene_type:complete
MNCALAAETATAQVATTAVMAVYIQGILGHHQIPLAHQGALGLADDMVAGASHICRPYLSHRQAKTCQAAENLPAVIDILRQRF